MSKIMRWLRPKPTTTLVAAPADAPSGGGTVPAKREAMNYFQQQARAAKLNQGEWSGPREIAVSPGIAANAGLSDGDIITLGSDGNPARMNGIWPIPPQQKFRVKVEA